MQQPRSRVGSRPANENAPHKQPMRDNRGLLDLTQKP